MSLSPLTTTTASSAPPQPPAVRYITQLTLSQKRDFLNSFDLVFCDCDGVIWHNLFDAIPGATETIKYLRGIGKQVVFVTNNSISSTKDQIQKFAKANLHVEEHDLIHPAKTISEYLKSKKFEGLILCFASTKFKEHLRENGFQVDEEVSKERLIDGSLLDLHNAIYSKDPVKAVVIDIDFNLTAWKLMRAQVHLKNPECLFIAGAADPRVPFGGNELLGPGAFIQLVEEANQRKAQVFGKPGAELGALLKTLYNIKEPSRVLMVGDSLRSDIKFGNMCGFQTLFVLTEVVDSEEIEKLHADDLERPDYVVEKLADLKDLI